MRKITRCLLGLLLLCLLAGAVGCTVQGTELLSPKERLYVATTTSLYDTGLWGYRNFTLIDVEPNDLAKYMT